MPPVPRKVRVVETGRVYVSARSCALDIGGEFGAVYACLRGVRKTHKGYSFEYV